MLFFLNKHKSSGFTLIELMIAMTIGVLVMAAVMTAFISQHRSYLAQDDIIDMQQNGRAAMDMLTRDIRTVGYDPNNLGAAIITPNANNFIFTREDDTAVNRLERIEYVLFDAFQFTVPPNNDGIVDDLALQVTDDAGNSAGRQVIAENIGQLEFRYLDNDGEVTANTNDIRSIIVFILAVASQPDPSFVNNNRIYTYTYTSPSGAPTVIASPAFNDNLRRRLFVTTVNCRNVGL